MQKRWFAFPRPSCDGSFVALLLLLASSFACQSKQKVGSDGRPADSGAGARAAPPACRELFSGSSVVVGTNSKASLPSEDDPDLELPFAVELGEAKSATDTFAVGGLEVRGGASFSLFAVIEAGTGRGHVLELGRTFGDAGPPVVAAAADGWLIAVPNNDAAGGVFQLMKARAPWSSQNVLRGAEVSSGRRDASSLSMAVHGERGLLVWTTSQKHLGRIARAVVNPRDATLQGGVGTLALEGDQEAEAPRLVARPGGYYLAYIVRTPGTQLAPRDARSAEESGGDFLEDGPSAIEILPLDMQGAPVGSAQRITPPGVRIVTFDLGVLPKGGALVTYQDDKGGPGTERSSVVAVLIRPDGSRESRTWDLSAGPPTILVDARPAERDPWAILAIPGDSRMRIAPLGSDPLNLGEPLDDPKLGAEVLALSGGRLLRANAQGVRRELSLVECDNPVAPK